MESQLSRFLLWLVHRSYLIEGFASLSSSFDRDPLDGVITQNNRVVGGVCLPSPMDDRFIEQFNDCYGPIRMQIRKPIVTQSIRATKQRRFSRTIQAPSWAEAYFTNTRRVPLNAPSSELPNSPSPELLSPSSIVPESDFT